MLNIFKKSLVRGFTLIELLVVIAIIGLLSTVIAAPITQARKKGRDGKKVADLRQITGALQQYADDNLGNYPYRIDDLLPVYLSSLPPFATTTSAVKDRYMYTTYITTDARRVGFHLGSKLEAPNLALSDDRDCFGAGPITASEQYCVDVALDAVRFMSGVASNYNLVAAEAAFPTDTTVPGVSAYTGTITGGVGPTAWSFVPFVLDPATGNSTTTVPGSPLSEGDFAGGSDNGGTACVASINASATACIYDITN